MKHICALELYNLKFYEYCSNHCFTLKCIGVKWVLETHVFRCQNLILQLTRKCFSFCLFYFMKQENDFHGTLIYVNMLLMLMWYLYATLLVFSD